MSRLGALTLVLLLAACGPTPFTADVTRFTTLPATDGARSFTILPDPAQKGSLEFQQYANLVAEQLALRGWRPVPASADAQAVVFIHWGVGAPRTVAWESPAAMWTGWGPWYGGGIYQPFPYYQTEVTTTWPQWLSLEILDGPTWRAGTRMTLFEGKAVTESGRPMINPNLPYLVRAIFSGFPGISGHTVKVEIPPSQ
ncbi:MAG: DUF4136 domain-containing protein [Magnetospirillum sp.]|nr:DUF4136 domain-containing protein [Magnetospirillum sp.]